MSSGKAPATQFIDLGMDCLMSILLASADLQTRLSLSSTCRTLQAAAQNCAAFPAVVLHSTMVGGGRSNEEQEATGERAQEKLASLSSWMLRYGGAVQELMIDMPTYDGDTAYDLGGRVKPLLLQVVAAANPGLRVLHVVWGHYRSNPEDLVQRFPGLQHLRFAAVFPIFTPRLRELLPNLRSLDLRGINWQGACTNWLPPQVTELRLGRPSGSMLLGLPACVLDSTSLEWLDLEDGGDLAGLSGDALLDAAEAAEEAAEDEGSLLPLQQLRGLDLSRCVHTAPDWVALLPNLEALSVDNGVTCMVDEPIEEWENFVGSLPKIRLLSLRGNEFPVQLLESAVGQCTTFEALFVDGNGWEALPDGPYLARVRELSIDIGALLASHTVLLAAHQLEALRVGPCTDSWNRGELERRLTGVQRRELKAQSTAAAATLQASTCSLLQCISPSHQGIICPAEVWEVFVGIMERAAARRSSTFRVEVLCNDHAAKDEDEDAKPDARVL